jgi:hypothetical protein
MRQCCSVDRKCGEDGRPVQSDNAAHSTNHSLVCLSSMGNNMVVDLYLKKVNGKGIHVTGREGP